MRRRRGTESTCAGPSAARAVATMVLVLCLPPLAAAKTSVGPDMERLVPSESRRFYQLKDPEVRPFGTWGAGLWIRWAHSGNRFEAIPDITPTSQSIVSHRVEGGPYFFAVPWSHDKGSLWLSASLPLVFDSGAEPGTVAAQLFDVSADDGFDFGDLQIGLQYAHDLSPSLTLGAGVELRLPTGRILNEHSFAEDAWVRLVPRAQLAWEITRGLVLAVELGELLHLPGVEDVPLMPDGEALWAETFFQAGLSYRLAAGLVLSAEGTFWLNDHAVTSAYSREFYVTGSIGWDFSWGGEQQEGPETTAVGERRTFTPLAGGGADALQGALERRYGPLYYAYLKASYLYEPGRQIPRVIPDPEPRPEDRPDAKPVVAEIESDPAGVGGAGCVRFASMDEATPDSQPSSDGAERPAVVVPGRPIRITGERFLPGATSRPILTLDPYAGSAKRQLPVSNASPTRVDSELPPDTWLGHHVLRLTTEEGADEAGITVCPVVEPQPPEFFRFERLSGRFSAGVDYEVSIDGKPTRWTWRAPGAPGGIADHIAPVAGTERTEETTRPAAVLGGEAERLAVRPVSVSGGAQPPWLAMCHGTAVALSFDRQECCAVAWKRIEAHETGKLRAGLLPDYLTAVGGDACTREAIVYFDVADYRKVYLRRRTHELPSQVPSRRDLRLLGTAFARIDEILGTWLGAPGKAAVSLAVQGCVSRLLRLDEDGLPVPGVDASESDRYHPVLARLRSWWTSKELCHARSPEAEPLRAEASYTAACPVLGRDRLIQVSAREAPCSPPGSICPVRPLKIGGPEHRDCISAEKATVQIRLELPGR